jgi:flavin-dependent dehydrogenase
MAETAVVGPGGDTVTMPIAADGIRVAVVRRTELDAALVGAARRAGADLREGAGVIAVEPGRDAVTVATGASRLRARWVVAADGHFSTVRRLVASRRGPDLGTWHAFRRYYRGVDETRLLVDFEPDLLPGYAWVFPLADGRANVGLGVLRDGSRPVDGKSLAALWRSVLERSTLRDALGPDAEPDGPTRAWPIPARFHETSLGRSRILFAGDAAGVVDPMTGEGIAQALATGALAARAIASGGSTEAVTGRYRGAVRRAISADLRLARVLQRVLRSPHGVRAAIRAADVSSWTRSQFGRWMFEEYPRALVLTPARWRRGALSARGAYAGTGGGGGTDPSSLHWAPWPRSGIG